MDLGFVRLEKGTAVTALPTDLAVLLVGIAARQAASPTARHQSLIEPLSDQVSLLTPAHGCFDPRTASALIHW